MAKDNDRDRLHQIEQTDLTESRINEDLVHWLKTKGPTWLLVVLVAVTAYLFIIRWKQHQASVINQAWIDYANNDLPESLEEVADSHAGVYAVPLLAKARAADSYMRCIVTGRDFGDDPALAPILTDEQRSDYLDKADRLFESIVTSAADIDSDYDTLPHVVYAIFGRAAVAESRGDAAAAKSFYDEAAAHAEQRYPALAAQARHRAESVDEATQVVFLPGVAELPSKTPGEARTPLVIDKSLENLIFPEKAPVIPEPLINSTSGAFGETPK